ncbi:NACHT domain-containing protein [Candidatus Leptofilum sp.]|uniref:NACHT N-terminal Helical domain 1-containing protein n=1 Tax=Candidatus Leptofilum sp. TaxID=3241576 RepID=UPI003B5AEA40
MSSTGIILLKYLAPVLARMAFAKALGGTISPEDVAESLSDLGPFTDKIEAITGDYKAATRGNRLFEEAGEIAAENLTELFGREGDGIEKDRIEAIVKDAANLLERKGLRLLIDASYESTKFIKAVGAIPLDHLHLDSHEVEFFRRVLQESGRILFTVAEKLPHFDRENAARLLQNDAQILFEVREAIEILRRMEAVSQENNPHEIAANFERDYRRLLSVDLDKLRLFGVPQIDRYHQPLTIAFIQLHASERKTYKREQKLQLSLFSELNSTEYFHYANTLEQTLSAERILIVGRAGAGKTTLLKWIAVRLAKQDETTPVEWHGKIPFYVRVRDYADKPFPSHRQLPVQYGRSQDLEGSVPIGWVDQQGSD